MGFRLVPKLVTLNDPEWHNGRYFASFYCIRQFWWPIMWLKTDPYCLRKTVAQRTDFRNLWYLQRLPRTGALMRDICVISTSTSVLINVNNHVTKDLALRWWMKTNFVFDHFGLNITAEHNCSREATKSSLVYQSYTQWDDFSLITNCLLWIP